MNDLLQRKPLDARGNRLIDFSNCGNKSTTMPATEKELAHQSGNQSARIQTALDNLAANTMLVLGEGTWLLDNPLIVRASNIGLAGKSQKTILRATWRNSNSIISIKGNKWREDDADNRSAVINNVPVGTRQIRVADDFKAEVGDSVIVRRYTNWKYIDELKCRAFGWTPADYTFDMDRKIKRIIDANTIELDDDVAVEIHSMYGGGQIFTYRDSRISNIAVKNLALTSVFTSATDEQHAKIGVDIANARNVTVSDIKTDVVQTHTNMRKSARFITVERGLSQNPKSQVTSKRRYTYNIDGVNCLVTQCLGVEGRHTFVSGPQIMGPNVFHRCREEQATVDSGPHQRHASGFLYDNVIARLRVQHAASGGTGHGVTGVWHFLWNTSLTHKVAIQSFGTTALNVGVGVSALDDRYSYPAGGDERTRMYERGQHVEPQSLLEYQSAPPEPPEPPAPAAALHLYNSATDKFIQVLQDGMLAIPYNASATILYVPDEIVAGNVVEFSVNGALARKEGTAPYCISGDNNGDLEPWNGIQRNVPMIIGAKEYKDSTLVRELQIKIKFI